MCDGCRLTFVMCADSLKFQVEPSATALTKEGRLDGLLYNYNIEKKSFQLSW
jgi:hypothetical protein